MPCLRFCSYPILSACAKERDEAQIALTEAKQKMDASPGQAALSEETGLRRSSAKPTISGKRNQTANRRFPAAALEGHGLTSEQSTEAKERLLEYFVSLNYDSKDFPASRRRLIQIVSQYGFIVSSQARAGESPYLSSTIKVKTQDLFRVLEKLDELGTLKSEDIRTTDHTEAMVLQQMRLRRESLRQQRRARASTNSNRKDWAARERLLSQSEDKADRAEHEQWKIRDRVSWAEIQVYVHGPEMAPEIRVPVYRAAFIGLLNFLLQLSYLAIYLVPLALLGYLAWRFALRPIFERLFVRSKRDS